jgi:hypothetical protein
MIIMPRKAQAAMEFLMTYGWAILVVLVVLGALTYFGILSPQTLLPSRCETGETWLKCKDYKVDSAADQITIVLENNWQYDIEISSLDVTSTVHSCAVTYAAGSEVEIPQGTEASFSLTPCSDSIEATRVGKKIRHDMTIGWQRSDIASPVSHSMTGVLVAQVE